VACGARIASRRPRPYGRGMSRVRTIPAGPPAGPPADLPAGLPAPEQRSLRSPAELAAAGLVTDARARALEPVTRRYAMALTPAVADLIDPADPRDPIAAQFVPDPAELATAAQELADPIGDEAHAPVEGIVHRYHDRVL